VALLEQPNSCAICERPVQGYVKHVPVYFCPSCFEEHKASILLLLPWVKMLLNEEKARRKRRNRLLNSVGLPTIVYTYQGVAL
jgi:hypothetical protein